MIYCKPFVPKTPPKERIPSLKNDHPSMRKENPSKSIETPSMRNKNNESESLEETPLGHSSPVSGSTSEMTSLVPQQIPGLPEGDRLKAQKVKEKKEKKSKPGKKDKIDTNQLTKDDFLLKPNKKKEHKAEDQTEDFQFSDVVSDSDTLEASHEDIEEDNLFSTPLKLKSTFARTYARSESRSRSRSASVKRNFPSPTAENENQKKIMKSGLPTLRKSSGL